MLRGTAQNPDVFFQAREAVNPFYLAVAGIVAARRWTSSPACVGRQYHLFDYLGAPDAERVIVVWARAPERSRRPSRRCTARGEKVGLLKVRLFRPFAADALVAALPPTARRIAVLDRTKEPGALGEPLYLDVVAALAEAWPSHHAGNRGMPRVVGGRYGLSSKEFTPAMVKPSSTSSPSPPEAALHGRASTTTSPT